MLIWTSSPTAATRWMRCNAWQACGTARRRPTFSPQKRLQHRLLHHAFAARVRLAVSREHFREELCVALERGQGILDLVREHGAHLAEAGEASLARELDQEALVT